MNENYNYPNPNPMNPYGYDFQKSTKSKVAAALLAFFLGYLGIHRFYLGHTNTGIAMLVLWIVGSITVWFVIGVIPLAVVGIWGFVDFIRILVGGLRDVNGLELS